jgi:hypothetical protein
MGDVYLPSTNEGTCGLFGFAVADFCADTSQTPDDISNELIFGAVIDNDDTHHDIENIVKMVSLTNVKMLIFDYINASDDVVDTLEKIPTTFPEYEELENVYDTRIVFIKKQSNME